MLLPLPDGLRQTSGRSLRRGGCDSTVAPCTGDNLFSMHIDPLQTLTAFVKPLLFSLMDTAAKGPAFAFYGYNLELLSRSKPSTGLR